MLMTILSFVVLAVLLYLLVATIIPELVGILWIGGIIYITYKIIRELLK